MTALAIVILSAAKDLLRTSGRFACVIRSRFSRRHAELTPTGSKQRAYRENGGRFIMALISDSGTPYNDRGVQVPRNNQARSSRGRRIASITLWVLGAIVLA